MGTCVPVKQTHKLETNQAPLPTTKTSLLWSTEHWWRCHFKCFSSVSLVTSLLQHCCSSVFFLVTKSILSASVWAQLDHISLTLLWIRTGIWLSHRHCPVRGSDGYALSRSPTHKHVPCLVQHLKIVGVKMGLKMQKIYWEKCLWEKMAAREDMWKSLQTPFQVWVQWEERNEGKSG